MLSWFAKPKVEPGLMAVAVEEQAAKTAHVVRSPGRRPLARRFASCELDARDRSDGLSRFAKTERLDRYVCTTLLSPAEYQMLLVEAPSVPREELKAAIRWRIKDLLDYHVDDATVDVLEVPSPPEKASKNRSMYAVAAPNEVVQRRIALFQDAGIALSVIDIPELAQRNVAALFERPGRATALLSIAEWGGLLTVSFDGELAIARRLEVTWLQLQQEAYRDHYLQRVSSEVRRSLDHFERQFHPLAVGEVLIAPLPQEVGLAAALGGALDQPVRAISLAEAIDFDGGRAPDDAELWSYLHVLGAALRVEEKTF